MKIHFKKQHMDIKPIQTKYKNYNFRSRLEARWAVFFDSLGWNWQYEVEGYVLPSGYYLPDFYFPEINVFAEVKAKLFSQEEITKCKELSKMEYNSNVGKSTHDVVLLEGQPDFKAYRCFQNGEEICEVVFVSDGDKYYPFFYSPEYQKEFFGDTNMAIENALSARFEHGEIPKT